MKQKNEKVIDLEKIRARQQVRQKYQREYYLIHKREAQAYQRQYSKNHRKKYSLDSSHLTLTREPIQLSYTVRDITDAPTEKALKMYTHILNEERFFSLQFRRSFESQ